MCRALGCRMAAEKIKKKKDQCLEVTLSEGRGVGLVAVHLWIMYGCSWRNCGLSWKQRGHTCSHCRTSPVAPPSASQLCAQDGEMSSQPCLHACCHVMADRLPRLIILHLILHVPVLGTSRRHGNTCFAGIVRCASHPGEVTQFRVLVDSVAS